MRVIYEVNLSVQRGIADAFRVWLIAHAQEMLSLPGFRAARILQVGDAAADATETVFCTQYELTGQDALDEYLRTHAARMRADGVARFGDRFSATRRVLQELGRY
jgi:hypothetical protein